jgi:FlaA1/EpsC-like NDP-sugar epimerase
MPSAPAIRINQIIEIIRRAGLDYKTVPSLGEMAVGKYKVSNLRTVQIEDLLGREPVQLQAEEIRKLLAGRRVMVTGAGGSIGSELCRQVAMQGPSELLLVERSEVQLFVVEQELLRRGHGNIVRALVADVLDEPRLRHIFKLYNPEIIFHAAAHKHVPMMESQPEEAIKNNTLGTALVAGLAREFGVERFILISTDKAINPTSVMGATKRLAEMLLQDMVARNGSSTRFMAVRFGNVLGSSGSVVPLFKDQIAAGGPVTVTHPQMTRYFMTIPEAAGLVLQSTVLGQGGEIFVLDMGKPVRILDLAKQMIELCGFEAGKDIRIEFTGVRPGEKLFEEISYSLESVSPTDHPKIMLLRGAPPDSESLKENLELLEHALDCANPEQLKRLLKVAVPEYQFSVPVEKKSQPAPVPPTHEPSRRAKPAEPEEVALAQL